MKATFIILSVFLLHHFCIHAQPFTPRIPSTDLGFLTFAPDARSAGMGEAGVALSPDANSAYWNASKLVFAEKDFGAGVSYTPWLRNLVDGMWLGYAGVYKKLSRNQAVGISVNYFDEGNGNPASAAGYFDARHSALNGTYSRQLGPHFSLGITLKYISSNPAGNVVASGVALQPMRTAAADLSAYYRKRFVDVNTGKDLTWSFGAVLSNLGGKVNYGAGTGTDGFLPTTFKIGGGLSLAANVRNKFSFILDASKLLVPTPSASGATVNNPNWLQGVISSFSDAPGGFREEMQEVTWSGGAEYEYKALFALRGGYFSENRYKGDRKFLTAGGGVHFLKYFNADFSYLFPVTKGSPLANTFRVSLSVYLNQFKV